MLLRKMRVSHRGLDVRVTHRLLHVGRVTLLGLPRCDPTGSEIVLSKPLG
jgi:hypothetical protein